MKKSKMLQNIENVIDIYYGKQNNHDVLANIILKEIEFHGMLPPCIHKKIPKAWTEYFSGEFVWEPEDDK